jgi:hypothetical protein
LIESVKGSDLPIKKLKSLRMKPSGSAANRRNRSSRIKLLLQLNGLTGQ